MDKNSNYESNNDLDEKSKFRTYRVKDFQKNRDKLSKEQDKLENNKPASNDVVKANLKKPKSRCSQKNSHLKISDEISEKDNFEDSEKQNNDETFTISAGDNLSYDTKSYSKTNKVLSQTVNLSSNSHDTQVSIKNRSNSFNQKIDYFLPRVKNIPPFSQEFLNNVTKSNSILKTTDSINKTLITTFNGMNNEDKSIETKTITDSILKNGSESIRNESLPLKNYTFKRHCEYNPHKLGLMANDAISLFKVDSEYSNESHSCIPSIRSKTTSYELRSQLTMVNLSRSLPNVSCSVNSFLAMSPNQRRIPSRRDKIQSRQPGNAIKKQCSTGTTSCHQEMHVKKFLETLHSGGHLSPCDVPSLDCEVLPPLDEQYEPENDAADVIWDCVSLDDMISSLPDQIDSCPHKHERKILNRKQDSWHIDKSSDPPTSQHQGSPIVLRPGPAPPSPKASVQIIQAKPAPAKQQAKPKIYETLLPIITNNMINQALLEISIDSLTHKILAKHFSFGFVINWTIDILFTRSKKHESTSAGLRRMVSTLKKSRSHPSDLDNEVEHRLKNQRKKHKHQQKDHQGNSKQDKYQRFDHHHRHHPHRSSRSHQDLTEDESLRLSSNESVSISGYTEKPRLRLTDDNLTYLDEIKASHSMKQSVLLYEAKIRQLLSTIEKLELGNLQIKDQNKILQKRHAALLMEFKQDKREIQFIKSQTQVMLNRIQTVPDKLTDLEKENIKLKMEIKDYEKTLTQRDQLFASERQINASLSEEIIKMEAESVNKDLMKNVCDEFEQLNEEYELLKRTLDETEDKLIELAQDRDNLLKHSKVLEEHLFKLKAENNYYQMVLGNTNATMLGVNPSTPMDSSAGGADNSMLNNHYGSHTNNRSNTEENEHDQIRNFKFCSERQHCHRPNGSGTTCGGGGNSHYHRHRTPSSSYGSLSSGSSRSPSPSKNYHRHHGHSKRYHHSSGSRHGHHGHSNQHHHGHSNRRHHHGHHGSSHHGNRRRDQVSPSRLDNTNNNDSAAVVPDNNNNIEEATSFPMPTSRDELNKLEKMYDYLQVQKGQFEAKLSHVPIGKSTSGSSNLTNMQEQESLEDELDKCDKKLASLRKILKQCKVFKSIS